MRWRLTFLLLASTALSCWSDNVPVETNPSASDQSYLVSDPTPEPQEVLTKKVLETYSNQTEVARPGRNKIEIDIIQKGQFREYHSDNLAVIRLYSKDNSGGWDLRQTLEIADDAIDDADVKLSDYNGDGLKDVTFVSSIAARGANVMRTLLIYNKDSDNLVHIENSEEFPNLEYSRKLKCITAWSVYGGTSTDFARIEGNQLKSFATVENFEGFRTVTVIDQHGKQNVISRNKISDEDVYIRYTNYRPLEH